MDGWGDGWKEGGFKTLFKDCLQLSKSAVMTLITLALESLPAEGDMTKEKKIDTSFSKLRPLDQLGLKF